MKCLTIDSFSLNIESPPSVSPPPDAIVPQLRRSSVAPFVHADAQSLLSNIKPSQPPVVTNSQESVRSKLIREQLRDSLRECQRALKQRSVLLSRKDRLHPPS